MNPLVYNNSNTIFFVTETLHCRKLTANDFDALLHYLHQLGDATRQRFGPHAFNSEALNSFYNFDTGFTGYIAEECHSQGIIAYAIIKTGLLQHDKDRLLAYQYPIMHPNCCTFAPSVADQWQGRGIGKLLFNYILKNLEAAGIKQVILWGGVQASNEKAVTFYKKLGFITLGVFEYNGSNLDMLLEIP